jgi:hypothetical protein
LRLHPLAGIYPDVFAHAHFSLGGLRLLLMLFWKAFMFSVTVRDSAS